MLYLIQKQGNHCVINAKLLKLFILRNRRIPPPFFLPLRLMSLSTQKIVHTIVQEVWVQCLVHDSHQTAMWILFPSFVHIIDL